MARYDRWDRDRFDRDTRERYGGDRDFYRLEEREDQGARGRDVLVDERMERRDRDGRYEERERYFEEQRGPSGRPLGFLDDPAPSEVGRQALAPYRRPRPQFLRRQSSLDTFDRKPMPRYGDEYRMPPDVPVPLPYRRQHSPSRGRYYEEVEERYRDSDEDYRDVRVSKGGSGSRSRMRSRSVRRRRSRSSSSSSSEEENTGSIIGRRGRTKMPKRLVHRSAIIELGWPYVEEENFWVVQRALDKHHIDRVVEISKKYREDQTITYKYDGLVGESKRPEVAKEVTKEVIKEDIKPDGEVIIEKKTEVKDEIFRGPKGPTFPVPPKGVDVVKKVTTTTTIDPPDHHHRHQDLAVMVPQHHHHLSERDITREIRALELERESLRLERHDHAWDVEKRDRRKDVYRVERDRKGRMALIRSAH